MDSVDATFGSCRGFIQPWDWLSHVVLECLIKTFLCTPPLICGLWSVCVEGLRTKLGSWIEGAVSLEVPDCCLPQRGQQDGKGQLQSRLALELQTSGGRLKGSVGGPLAWMSGVPLGPELAWRMEWWVEDPCVTGDRNQLGSLFLGKVLQPPVLARRSCF